MSSLSFMRGNDGSRAWKAYFHAEIERLERELPRGSDSWTPHSPTDTVRFLAELIVNSIERDDLPRPFVVPGSEGDLQIKWRIGTKELSFFITNTKTEVLQVEKNDAWEADLVNTGQIKEFINWLIS
jgi:hypothetical protein